MRTIMTDEEIQKQPIPVTVFTGFLGAGKTTIILDLITSAPQGYRIAWLKNEIGSVAVDSELAKQGGVSMVKEMLNGCVCHVLIGELGTALQELASSDPDRIIIETSGSAAPAPIVWEVRRHKNLVMDGVITVIDVLNFPGYRDTSYTAKIQAQYNDIILVNKHETLDERKLDLVLDDVFELNPDTPKIKTDRGRVDAEMIFGIETTLFSTEASIIEQEDLVPADHQAGEVDLIELHTEKTYTKETVTEILESLPKEDFFRIKGVIRSDDGSFVINYAYGDFNLQPIDSFRGDNRIVFMGPDLGDYKSRIATKFGVPEETLEYHPKAHHHHH
jgi:G3E family GTPase